MFATVEEWNEPTPGPDGRGAARPGQIAEVAAHSEGWGDVEPSGAIRTLREAVAVLAADDLDRPDVVLSARVVALREVIERLDAELVRTVGVWDARQAWAADGALDPQSWLAHHTGCARREARALVRSARLAHRHDDTGAALASGELGVAHLEALGRATSRGRDVLYADHEAVLLAAAADLHPDDFEHACRHWQHAADDLLDRPEPARQHDRRHLHLSTTLFGAVAIDGLLDAEGGATVLAALEALDRPDPTGGPEPARSPAQRRADALVDLARLALGDGDQPGVSADLDVVATDPLRARSGRVPRAAIAATVAAAALLDPAPRPRAGLGLDLDPPGRLDPGDPEPDAPRSLTRYGIGSEPEAGLVPTRRGADLDRVGPIPSATLQRLACDATVRRVLVDPAGEILDLGRATRVVSPAQRRALVHRDRGCAFPGCDRPHHWCDAHHLVPWTAGGATDLQNLALLCRRHHTLVHEGRWRLDRAPDGTLAATRPDRGTPGRAPP